MLPTFSRAQVPDWLMAKSAGGVRDDYATSIKTDASGNIYIVGNFYSTSIIFGATTLINTNTAGNTSDIFLVKYDASGNVIWAKKAGRNDLDAIYSVTTDTSGNVYLAGAFWSASITFGATTLTNVHVPGSDMFIVKYDSNGMVIWAKSAGGSGYDYAYSVTSDDSENVYVAGAYNGSNIAFSSNTLTNDSSNTYDVFLAKYDVNGNLLWAKRAGGKNNDVVISIASDKHGNIFMTGNFSSPSIDFDATNLINHGYNDIYLVKYDLNGNALWAKSAGGSGADYGHGVAVDLFGDVYVVGGFSSSSVTFGLASLTNTGIADMFIVKYNTGGNVLWAKSAVGSGNNFANSVACDNSGNAYVLGGFNNMSITFDLDTLINDDSSGLTSERFITKYDTSGTVLWARSAGGNNSENANCITIDGSANIYITGTFQKSTITFGSTTLTNADSTGIHSDIFIAKLGTPVGIEILESNIGVELFPNPFKDYFTIKVNSTEKKRCSLIIKDLTGREIERRENVFVDEDIQMGYHLYSGIYFAEIIQGNTRKVIKLIKNK